MDSVVNENYKDGEKQKIEDDMAANAEGSEFDDSKAKFLNGGKGLEETTIDVEIKSKDGDSFTGLGKEELMEYATDPFWVRTRLILFILFWVGWIAMLAAAIVIIVLAPRCPYRPDQKWWNKEVVYQVYPKSFLDGANNDGLGDLAGVKQKYDYFNNLTANVIWLNAIYQSPLRDSGYDVTDHKNISEIFGNVDELKDMMKQLHKKGKKVVLDFIPNHTSDKHVWFDRSRKKEGKYAEYYIWAPGTPGTPPNNWKSVHGGSAWKYDDVRKEYYLHQFLDFEPDLNLRNPDVMEEMESILRFWLEKGVDGFNIVGAPYLVESDQLGKDENSTGVGGQDDYQSVDHSLTADQPETLEVISKFREIVDSYVKKPGSERLLFASMKGTVNTTNLYMGTPEKKGVHLVITEALVNHKADCNALCLQDLIDSQLTGRAKDGWTGWTLSNQDSHRFASQVGAKYIKAMHTLQLLLPGTAVIYYGDEIGLKDAPVPSFNLTQDPVGIAAGESGYQQVSRDAYRTPMRWNGKANAGFSSATPWLPVDKNSQPNVQAQLAHFGDYTPLEFFFKLARLRKEPSFQWGEMSYSVVNKNLLSFFREAEGFPGFLVAINFGKEKVVMTFTRENGEMPETGEVVAHSSGTGPEYSGTHQLKGHSVLLKAGDVVVYKLQA